MAHRPLVSDTITRTTGGPVKGYPHHRPRKRNENTYSDEDKAKGLIVATLVGSRKAAQWLPIPQQTLSDWKNGKGITQEVYNMAKHFADELAAKLEDIADLIAGDMPNKIAGAGLKDQAIALGVVVDKRQLLNNLPTAIEATQSLTSEERAAKIREILERAKTSDDKGDTTE